MASKIHRDSLSAWKGLREIAGLEIDGRDEDLVAQLKDHLDPGAIDLASALARANTDKFLQALFQTVQPFVGMFRDVLSFFERAGARYGQSQWKICVGDAFIDLRHFEEFLEHWTSINCEFDVPALDQSNAFIFNSIRIEDGDYRYLREADAPAGSIGTGIPDVDSWLAHYSAGRYAPFPRSLYPDQLPRGLDDAACVVMAALSVIRQLGLTRDQMLTEHRARSHRSVQRDAFHPWTIAQSETDFWLRSSVMYLANIVRKPREEREAFGARLARAYSAFPRRQFNAKLDVSDFERLLSLPAWKKRHELYGVWVATAIISALDDHAVEIKHDNGQISFSFSETEIADIESSRPKLSLISERRSALPNPIGKGRTSAVQPDYGMWTRNIHSPKCVLIVEVKHYKKRSRQNFRAALIDYAGAHELAKVILVNYGPVGKDFLDLPESIRDRCKLIGYLNPEDRAAQLEFRDLVRSCVGDPVIRAPSEAEFGFAQIVAIDTSGSMDKIVRSSKLIDIIDRLSFNGEFALIDQELRGIEQRESLTRWFEQHELGQATSLFGPVSELLETYENMIVITDQDGLDSLASLEELELIACADHPDARVIRIHRSG